MLCVALFFMLLAMPAALMPSGKPAIICVSISIVALCFKFLP